MELIYAAILLHKAGKPITEENVKKVLSSVGIEKSEAEIKALIAALDGVDIEEAIKATAMPIATQASAEPAKVEQKQEEKKEETKEAAAGLGSLFG